MPRIIDLTNQIFDQLTVLELDEEKSKQKHRKWWICKCSCNKIISVASDKLRSGHTTSCGCKKYKQAEDLRGKIFGDLKVVERDYNSHKDGAVWKCKCLLCNNPELISIKAVNLKLGKTTSCGCSIKSKGERQIIKILNQLDVEYETQYSFSDLTGNFLPLRFDFAIFKNKKLICLIEYQGQQHFESVDYFGGQEKFNKQQTYDSQKREYCKRNSIRLIEIPYYDYNNLSLEYIQKMIDYDS